MIVISTPTGQIGRHLLDAVLDGDEEVRVIARDPSRLPDRVRERVEVVPGSQADPEVVTAALAGADGVFWVVPPDPRADSLAGHIERFARPLCDAITSQGVKRVVAVSSLGRGTATNAGQISAIFAMDDMIEDTGVNYRSLRMPGFMENMLRQLGPIRNQGMFFDLVDGDLALPSCATRDIAAVAARLLHDGSWAGQGGVAVLGPEDLSQNDKARIMSEVLGRPIRYQRVPGEAYKASLTGIGMSDAWARGLLDMGAAIDRGIYAAEPRTPESSSPTTFRQWCEDTLRPALLELD